MTLTCIHLGFFQRTSRENLRHKEERERIYCGIAVSYASIRDSTGVQRKREKQRFCS